MLCAHVAHVLCVAPLTVAEPRGRILSFHHRGQLSLCAPSLVPDMTLLLRLAEEPGCSRLLPLLIGMVIGGRGPEPEPMGCIGPPMLRLADPNPPSYPSTRRSHVPTSKRLEHPSSMCLCCKSVWVVAGIHCTLQLTCEACLCEQKDDYNSRTCGSSPLRGHSGCVSEDPSFEQTSCYSRRRGKGTGTPASRRVYPNGPCSCSYG